MPIERICLVCSLPIRPHIKRKNKKHHCLVDGKHESPSAPTEPLGYLQAVNF